MKIKNNCQYTVHGLDTGGVVSAGLNKQTAARDGYLHTRTPRGVQCVDQA